MIRVGVAICDFFLQVPSISSGAVSAGSEQASRYWAEISLCGQAICLTCWKTVPSQPLISVRPHFGIKGSQDETIRFTNFIHKVWRLLWLGKYPEAQGRYFLNVAMNQSFLRICLQEYHGLC